MKKVNLLLLIALLQMFAVISIKGQDSTLCNSSCCCKPDAALAPAGIMVDHVHEKGKFGIAYGYMNMAMRIIMQLTMHN